MSSFKPNRKFKRTTGNRLYELYCSEEGLAQFAVDYILARNKEFVAPAAIRQGVLVVGNTCVQNAAKQITERLFIEKEALKNNSADAEEQ